MNDAACNALEAVTRAQGFVDNGGQYLLGTGDYWPHTEAWYPADYPWTSLNGEFGSDCAGFAISFAWKLRRHRPGFNHGPWATVSDDVNSDSALEDAHNHQELFIVPKDVRPGDLLIYPSIHLNGHRFIGHVGLVERVPEVFDPVKPNYNLLTVLQCHGPNHHRPGVVRTDGSVWQHHDSIWPKPEHRTQVIRPKERL